MENDVTIFNVGDMIWTTKSGEKIRYRDLGLDHIKNIAKKSFIRKEYYSNNILNDIDLYDYDEHECSFAKEMETELLRRTICKTLKIYL